VPRGQRASLRADCERCFGLCCVAQGFSASADFAIDKQPGQACPNLREDFRCAIHERLRQRGFAGCAVYDCFGAGQQVAQVTFGGQDWRRTPGIAEQMFGVFTVMRQLHELLWYLTEALTLPAARPLRAELSRALARTERLTRGSPSAVAELDVDAHRREINVLLRRASELARAGSWRPHAGLASTGPAGADLAGTDLTGADLAGADLAGADLAGADLAGKDLSGADLSGASLRGADLIGANLTSARLRTADLTGADLRGADLSGADLAGSLFLTQSQLEAAKGDAATGLSPQLTRPAHWRLPATPGRRRAAAKLSGAARARHDQP
jgi:uncharacterized protein YjbI with pentapeptide repeats